MLAHIGYCRLFFLLYFSIFVELCPPSSSPKPTLPPTSAGHSISATGSATTTPPSVLRRKELLLVPIKGTE